MVTRICKIMEREGLTPSKFADKIGVQRPALSHVLNGRNNVSLDMVMKIMQAFPEISTDWMLYGNGDMSKQHALITSEGEENTPFEERQEAAPVNSAAIPQQKKTAQPMQDMEAASHIIRMDSTDKRISKIMIFYSDDTFETFTSEKSRKE